jgi:hypothetical protein
MSKNIVVKIKKGILINPGISPSPFVPLPSRERGIGI